MAVTRFGLIVAEINSILVLRTWVGVNCSNKGGHVIPFKGNPQVSVRNSLAAAVLQPHCHSSSMRLMEYLLGFEDSHRANCRLSDRASRTIRSTPSSKDDNVTVRIIVLTFDNLDPIDWAIPDTVHLYISDKNAGKVG